MVLHTISPVYDNNSRVLVLGSFPSVKSREEGFFYGHKQNRFWKVLSNCFDCALPQTIDEKKELLLSNGVALWDVIHSCDITGSSDSSIKNAVPNDISKILAAANIQKIITNGKRQTHFIKSILNLKLILKLCACRQQAPRMHSGRLINCAMYGKVK